MALPKELEEAATKVAAGETVKITVRRFLWWFGMERRTWRNVSLIRSRLKHAGLITVPDFESTYLDGQVRFAHPPESFARPVFVEPEPEVISQAGVVADADMPEAVEVVEIADVPIVVVDESPDLAEAAHRISRLASANSPPLRVPPDATVKQAITVMLRNDFSQLPVMTSEREVKGLFSWKSLGSRLALGRKCEFVRDCMDRYQIIGADSSLFDAVRIIAEQDCVLVQDAKKTICGIVTASDISTQFRQLTEPFLLLGDIENRIRYLIDTKFDATDLQSAKDPDDTERKIENVSDMTFGEYVRLLQNEAMWIKFGDSVDRKEFTEALDKIRTIRNDVMHFDPDPLEAAALKSLKQFAEFLARFMEITDSE